MVDENPLLIHHLGVRFAMDPQRLVIFPSPKRKCEGATRGGFAVLQGLNGANVNNLADKPVSRRGAIRG